jgi:hypothetical protein
MKAMWITGITILLLYYNNAKLFVIISTPVPDQFQALVSTGDGNCLFNSMSILLNGTEGIAQNLRLASVLHGVEHFHHLLTMVCD